MHSTWHKTTQRRNIMLSMKQHNVAALCSQWNEATPQHYALNETTQRSNIMLSIKRHNVARLMQNNYSVMVMVAVYAF
jgi:hypothetical protein